MTVKRLRESEIKESSSMLPARMVMGYDEAEAWEDYWRRVELL